MRVVVVPARWLLASCVLRNGAMISKGAILMGILSAAWSDPQFAEFEYDFSYFSKRL